MAEMEPFIDALGKYMGESRKELEEKMAKLEARIAEIETRGVRYCGTRQRASLIGAATWCTHEGNLWACIEDAQPNEAPGASTKWQLAAKAGRDARERSHR